MNVPDFVRDIDGFQRKKVTDQIELFGWYLHEINKAERFSGSDINACFDQAHIARPTNVSVFLKSLCERKPPRVLRDSKGYRLSASARDDLGTKLKITEKVVKTTALLDGLAGRVTDPAQKTFLAETLICYKNGAYRAAIVMAWNLAYSHVIDHILNSELGKFNTQRARAFPKDKEVTKRSDFEDYKESRVLEIARGADILSAGSYKIMNEKLGKRNTAAHPSVTVVRDVTAEEAIHDLVENIILKPSL